MSQILFLFFHVIQNTDITLHDCFGNKAKDSVAEIKIELIKLELPWVVWSRKEPQYSSCVIRFKRFDLFCNVNILIPQKTSWTNPGANQLNYKNPYREGVTITKDLVQKMISRICEKELTL